MTRALVAAREDGRYAGEEELEVEPPRGEERGQAAQRQGDRRSRRHRQQAGIRPLAFRHLLDGEYASTLTGLGVVLVTVWQSIAQLEHAYGAQADSILTNHRSKLFYTGLSDPSAFRYLAAVLGDVEVETRSRSDAAEGRRSEQVATSREPLVPPHMARQMRPGDALLVHGTLPPAHVRAVPWFAERRLSTRARQALSFAEVKALASGNPLILEKAGLDAEVARLSRLRRSHQDDQHRLKRALSSAEARVARLGRRIAELEAAITRRTDTRGERSAMTVEGVGHRSPVDAGQHLLRVMASRLARPGGMGAIGIGRLGGFDLQVQLDHAAGELLVSLDGLDEPVTVRTNELLRTDPVGLLRRLEYRIQEIDRSLADARSEQRSATREAERARDRLGVSFPYDEALQAARRRQREVNKRLLQTDDQVNAERTVPERMLSRMAGVATPQAGRLRC